MYNKYIGQKYRYGLTTREIAKLIREQIKREFPNCKISVRSKYFSMGSEITVSILETPFKVLMDLNEIPEEAYLKYEKDRIETYHNETYHQLNPNYFFSEYDKTEWCNGVFLTKEGYDFLKRIVEIVYQYRRIEDDIQTDYYNTNFFFNLELGKWDKPFIQGG